MQAGVGFLLLAGLVLGGGLNLVNGNTARVVIIATYTPVALFIFARAAQVDLAVGGLLAGGSHRRGMGRGPTGARKGVLGCAGCSLLPQPPRLSGWSHNVSGPRVEFA